VKKANSSILVLSEEDVRSLLKLDHGFAASMPAAVEVIEKATLLQAQGEVRLYERVTVDYPEGMGTERSLRILPSIIPGSAACGIRMYTTHASRSRAAGPLKQISVLYDYETMDLVAILGTRSMHPLRTGAPSALATRVLARQDATTVGLLGTGRQAPGQLAGVSSVRKIEEVKVFSPNPDHRKEFARKMADQYGCTVEPVSSPDEAVRQRDIVITATNSPQPVFRSDWLSPGTHVVNIASGELDACSVKKATVVSAHRGQLIRDVPPREPFAGMLSRGEVTEEEIGTELGEILLGNKPGRKDEREITLFVNTGLGLWDVAIARWVYDLAREQGVGTRVTL
jgi:alanine dehydrogenase